MSVFHPASVLKREATQQTAPHVHPHEPVLITEQQVMFGTAAAVGAPAHRNMLTMMTGAVSSAAEHWRSRAERRPVRNHYPSRLSYLESSLMAREMDRL